jgi:hypothetical protein
LLCNYSKEFVKMAEKATGTAKNQNITNPKRLSLEVKRNNSYAPQPGLYYERYHRRNITISITVLFVRGEREKKKL